MNILEDLYFGNINPSDKCFDRNSEYAKHIKIISGNVQRLTDFLDALPDGADAQRLLSQILDAQGEIEDFCEFEKFIAGFRLGAGLMLETFIMPRQSVIRDIA